MTFQQIWSQLVKKDPDLAKPDAKVEFTSENLERLLRQVYDQGMKTGKAVAPPAKTSSWDTLFGG